MGIRIFTDSVSDIPKGLASEHNITVVPLQVNFTEGSYKDGVEIQPEEFFAKLKEATKLPTTSQVNPGEFVDAFKRVLNEGDDIICLTLSSKLSGTFSAAVTATSFLEAEDRIEVIDTKAVSFGYGMIALAAAQMVEDGATKQEIIAEIRHMTEHLENIFIFDTLEYLLKGGRLSSGEAFLGGLLNIKPILTIADGELKPMDKVRGRKRVIKWVIERLKSSPVDFSETDVAIYHADDEAYMYEIMKAVEAEVPVKRWLVSKVGPVVGTHSGPGCIAISYLKK